MGSVPLHLCATSHLRYVNFCDVFCYLTLNLGIYDVKGSVPVLYWKLHHRWERGRKGREGKFQNKANRTFYSRNSSTPAVRRHIERSTLTCCSRRRVRFLASFKQSRCSNPTLPSIQIHAVYARCGALKAIFSLTPFPPSLPSVARRGREESGNRD